MQVTEFSLPVTYEIYSRLDPLTKISFKFVCKKWKKKGEYLEEKIPFFEKIAKFILENFEIHLSSIRKEDLTKFFMHSSWVINIGEGHSVKKDQLLQALLIELVWDDKVGFLYKEGASLRKGRGQLEFLSEEIILSENTFAN